jgi:hypothetical protein
MRRLIQPILPLHLPSDLDIEMPKQVCHDKSHLMIGQSHSNAVSRTHGEGLKHFFLVGGVQGSVQGVRSGQPTFGCECGWRGEIEWMMVGSVMWNTDFDL